MTYSLAVTTRCVLHYDELLEIVPIARQPTDAQIAKLDMQQAFKAAAAAGHHALADDALTVARSSELMPESAARLAQQIARALLPYLNGKASK